MSSSADSLPSPIPANECSVIPFIFTAAMPVVAVTATLSFPSISLRSEMIFNNNKLFPAPKHYHYHFILILF